MSPITPDEILDLFDRSMPKVPRHMFHEGKCIFCGETERCPKFFICTRPSKEWVKLFLSRWDRAVKLWDDGYLFDKRDGFYWNDQITGQQKYAELCCTWLIPNGYVEPHVVAEGG